MLPQKMAVRFYEQECIDGKNDEIAVIHDLNKSWGPGDLINIPKHPYILLATTNIEQEQNGLVNRLLEAGFVPMVRWLSLHCEDYYIQLPNGVEKNFKNWLTLWVRVQKELTQKNRVPGPTIRGEHMIPVSAQVVADSFPGCCGASWLYQDEGYFEQEHGDGIKWEDYILMNVSKNTLLLKVAQEESDWSKVLKQRGFKSIPLSTKSTHKLWYRCPRLQALRRWPKNMQQAHKEYLARFV